MESANRRWLRNYGHRTETENLICDNLCDLPSQILGFLRSLEHFTIRNLNDELHTSFTEACAFREWRQAAHRVQPASRCSYRIVSIQLLRIYCFSPLRPV
jgi:hypothetical protein